MAKKVIKVTVNNFEREVFQADNPGPVLICFASKWAAPSRALDETLEVFAAECPDIKVVRIDVDANEGLVKAFGVRSVPTLVTMKGNKAIDCLVGNAPRDAINRLVYQSLDDAERAKILETAAPVQVMKPLRFKQRF